MLMPTKCQHAYVKSLDIDQWVWGMRQTIPDPFRSCPWLPNHVEVSEEGAKPDQGHRTLYILGNLYFSNIIPSHETDPITILQHLDSLEGIST